MNKQEFRVGNIIMTEPLNIPKMGIQSNGLIKLTELGVYQLQTLDSFKFEPVKLTPDILKRCGFKYERLGWDLPNSSFSLYHSLIPCIKEIIISNIPIKYLHLLQNLYFFLMNEELEVDISL